MESFDIELYETPENAGGKQHKMAITPLLGTRELVLCTLEGGRSRSADSFDPVIFLNTIYEARVGRGGDFEFYLE